MTIRLGEDKLLAAAVLQRISALGFCLTDLIPFTPHYCFVHKLYRVCLVIEMRRGKPNVHNLLC